VFTSEWNSFANRTYTSNFGINDFHPIVGDITKFDEFDVPDHEVLLAGFPCQPFSIAGVSKKNSLGRPHGFADEIQGTLFFDVARIIEAKRPQSFMLENVRNLISHDQGQTFSIICRTLTEDLGYHLFHKVMDASPYVPQGRRRIIIIGFSRDWHSARPDFSLDRIGPKSDGPKMRAVLHPEDGSEQPEASYTVGQRAEVNPKYVLTPRLWSYLQNYAKKHRLAGNGFGFGLVSPNDVARTLSARYYKDGSEILVSRGEAAIPRRLTPRECARLMGFPDSFLIPVSDTQAYKQFGNSVVVPLIEDVARQMVPQLRDIRNLAT
jgi:DNA (cytosine-5)-methyltransferase 1